MWHHRPVRFPILACSIVSLALAGGVALPAEASGPEPAAPTGEVAPAETTAEPAADPPAPTTASETWDDETDSAATAPVPPVQPVPTYVVPAPTSAPDPLLVERNRKLSEKMQYGERRLIAGRIAAGIGITFVAVGGMMFAIAGVRGRLDEAQPTGLWAGGGLMMGLGVAGLAAGIVLWVRGSRIVKEANRGELSLRPHATGLGLRF